MKWPVRIAGFLFAILFPVTSFHASESTIKIALPHDALTAEEREPLQEYLEKQMKRPVKFVLPGTYTETIQGLADDSVDFALLGGLAYVQAHSKIGAVPLVQRTSDKQFHAVFITGTNSSIKSLADLKGRTFAYGDINSTSGHLIPYLELKEAGMNPDKDLQFRYSGSHPITAALVETGAVEAGALDEKFYSSLIESGKIDGKKVRVFHTSKPFVDWVWVARKGLSESEQEAFSQALLSLKQGVDDRILKILRAEKFTKANNEEYVNIRQVAKELNMF